MTARALFLAAALLAAPVGAAVQTSATTPLTPPSAALPAPSPARLALARQLMEKILPPGAMQSVMKSTMSSISGSMLGTFLPADKRDAARARDPAFDERFRRTMAVMSTEMGRIMESMAPQMKEAMSLAYARRFDERQLADIGTFFATPSGAAYAREALSIASDPALVQFNLSMLPKLVAAMPDIGKKVEAATADLPPPPKPDNN